MEDKLRLNTELYGRFEGIIPRRDYFLNCIYIWAISTVLTLAFWIWFFISFLSSDNIDFNLSALALSAPKFLLALFIASVIITGILSASNIHRRLNDIFGEVKASANYIFTFFIVTIPLYIFLPIGLNFILSLVAYTLCCILLFKRGKISSQYPYDFKNEFNWGAFLGTWIWGIVNKSYIPFWDLILGFTPLFLLFRLYCGVKGNEWAYKSKKWQDVSQFNKSQEKQVVVFGFIGVFLYMAACMLFVLGFMLLMMNIPNEKSSENQDKTQPAVSSKLDNMMYNLVDMYFDSYEISENENKFYMKESDWKWASFDERRQYIELAASHSANYKSAQQKKQWQKYTSYSKYSELPYTKIYGTKTHQLLAEYVEDENDAEKKSVLQEVVSAVKAYKFYNVK